MKKVKIYFFGTPILVVLATMGIVFIRTGTLNPQETMALLVYLWMLVPGFAIGIGLAMIHSAIQSFKAKLNQSRIIELLVIGFGVLLVLIPAGYLGLVFNEMLFS